MTKTNRIVDLFENEADCLPLNIHMLHNVGIEETIVYSFLLRKKFEENAEEFFPVSLEDMQNELIEILTEHGIKHEIKGRAKSIYSIYKKMDKGIKEVY